jgi:nucleoside-diphosphate-sugar epimerase
MKILVTGANGFLGSHIVEALCGGGHEAVCLVRKTSDLKWLRGLKVEYRFGEFGDPGLPSETFKDIDAVVHNAAIVRACDPKDYYRINEAGTKTLLELIGKHKPGLKKFILISSQSAMGPSLSNCPKRVGEKENPVGDYGKSKLLAEKALRAGAGNIPFTILRPAAAYGPRDRDILIFFKLVKFGVIPKPSKQRIVQLVFAGDVAKAVLKSLENPLTNGKTYFLGNEERYSWDKIGLTISKAVSKKAFICRMPDPLFHAAGFAVGLCSSFLRKPMVLNPEKIREMLEPFWLADSAPAKEELGLDFTKLEKGAKITYLWYKENRWL